MAAKKNKKKKVRKKEQEPKSRLWLRDLVSISLGFVFAVIVIYLPIACMDRKDAQKVLQQYSEIVNEDSSGFNDFAERYLSTTENNKDFLTALEGVDISRPVWPMDTYNALNKDLHKLKPHVISSVLDYYQNLRDAEMLRRCIVEQQNNPQEIEKILIREFLRTLYEGSQLIPSLLYELEEGGGDE